MTQRAEIGLGDLIRVVDALAPNDLAMARRFARILQIGDGAEPEGHGAEDSADPRTQHSAMWDAEPRGAAELLLAPVSTSLPEPIDLGDHAAGEDQIWTPKPRRADALPALEAAGVLPAPEPLPAGRPELLAPALSLFQPRWTRSLLGAAMATRQADGDIDLDQLIDALAHRVALRELPRRPRRTMRLGAHVLVERGEGMLPFRRDVAQILQRIHRLGGEVTTLSFRGDPARVYGRSPRHVTVHVAPRAGTPVVAIGDLGVGDPLIATANRWLAWAQALHRKDCPVVIITPIARGDWPPALARVATIIQWDRATTASSVHRDRTRRRPG